MNIRKHIYLIYVLLFTSFCSFTSNVQAQGNKQFLKFSEDSVYLGRFTFTNQPVIHAFDFEVSGDSVITIQDVKTDCACITVNYPPKGLKPKDRGKIKFAYFPYKPGPFEKIFTIKTNGNPKNQELILTGYVEIFLPNPKLEFPHLLGNLRFKNRHISLGNITDEGVVRRTIEFYNASDKPITLLDSTITPPHIEVLFNDQNLTIGAGKRSFFDLYYHPETKNDYGYLVDNIILFTDDSLTQRLELTVTSVITHYFPPAEEIDFSQMPKISVLDEDINLGRVLLSRYSVEGVDFYIKNEGGVPLKIYRANTQEGIKVTSRNFSEIAPQDSIQFSVQVRDIGKTGKQERTVLLYTNDPLYPVKPLKVKLDVKRN